MKSIKVPISLQHKLHMLFMPVAMHSPHTFTMKGLDVYKEFVNMPYSSVGFTVYLTPCSRLYQLLTAAIQSNASDNVDNLLYTCSWKWLA